MMKLRRSVIGVAATGLTLLALTLGAAPANAAGYGYDNTDPATAAGGYCASGSTPIASYPIYASGVSIGTMEVRLSSACGTNWVRANVPSGGYIVKKRISRSGFTGVDEDDPSGGWSYGRQLYAPGSTCIVAEVYIYPASGGPHIASSIQAVC